MSNPAIDFPWEGTYVDDTLLVRTGKCVLHSIQFNGMTAVGDVSVYDGIDGTGTLIATLILRSAVHVSSQSMTYLYDRKMTTGIYLAYDQAFAGNFTVMWK